MPDILITRTDRIDTPLPAIPSDIDISQSATLKPIQHIAAGAGILDEELIPYGHNKAKISLDVFQRLHDASDGKLILVTAMTATRAGEGKTVTAIGLAQAFGKLGLNHMLCLREPSLGPTFGIKGGAAGGGFAQVLPMEDINMHFTGDLHAVTSAHNLLAAALDNHIHHGNDLSIDPTRIQWRRVLDLCDRQLRHCEVGLGSKHDGFPHQSGFDITAASEVMAVLALSADLHDLRVRLERMIVALDTDGKPIYAHTLNCVGAMVVLLKDALLPNLVQTYEHTPALIHCGPFANIAHGCNSVIATKMALKLSDYVITEAGFAADLGAEKFLNIKCPQSGLTPDATVLVVSVRALKLHGGAELDQLENEDLDALTRGFDNARTHVENLRKFGITVIVAINRFPSDTPAELQTVIDCCDQIKVPSELSEVAALGGDGGTSLANALVSLIKKGDNQYAPLYKASAPIKDKIETLAREIYRADGVDYEPAAEAMIATLEAEGLDQQPLCVAKTQLSISDDPSILGSPKNYRLTVKNIRISNGAGFLVVITGKIMLMPGMPKHSAIEKIDMDTDGKVINLA